MKKSVMKKWVKALRSGKYKQTRHRLKDGTGYCCLGVLCTVVGMKGRSIGVDEHGQEQFKFGQSVSQLPVTALRKSGMRGPIGAYGENLCLTKDNDTGKSFKQIANIIEKYWKVL